MTSTTFFIIFVPILGILLLAINLILAPHNPYQEKDSAFECGFHSFLGQNRTQFSISFFIFGLLFLLFDLEILLVYPYSVSSYSNDIYGLVIMMVFFVLLTLGFIFELGKNALTIDSRQTLAYSTFYTATIHIFLNLKSQMMLLTYAIAFLKWVKTHINKSLIMFFTGLTIRFVYTYLPDINFAYSKPIIYTLGAIPLGGSIWFYIENIDLDSFKSISFKDFTPRNIINVFKTLLPNNFAMNNPNGVTNNGVTNPNGLQTPTVLQTMFL